MVKIIKRFFSHIIPPSNWRFPVMLVVAVMVGLLLFVFQISNAPSYLSDKSEACINCHVMYSQYASWQHSSHFRVANCNDCHVPHDNPFRKYFFKASDGLRHSVWFTMRWEPQVIRIKDAGINVVQENCIRCHTDMIDMVSICEVTGTDYKQGNGKLCWDCHRETPHGTVGSLSSAPNALVPVLTSPVPEWILKQNSKIKSNTLKIKNQ